MQNVIDWIKTLVHNEGQNFFFSASVKSAGETFFDFAYDINPFKSMWVFKI